MNPGISNGSTRCILRYDDVCALSNTALERRVLEIVAARGAKVVMSVVPFVADTEWELRGPIPLRPLPREKVSLLKEFMPVYAGIALHGYSHQTVTRWSHLFEFGEKVSQQRQAARLRDGRAYLEDLFGVRVDTFVPPWSEYGRTTLAALEEAGFTALAGDLGLGPAEGNLGFIPACCDPASAEGALAAARSDPDAVVCIVLHEYDFKESGWPQGSMDLAAFDNLLAIPGPQGARWTGFDDYHPHEDWSARRLTANRELRDALPSPMRHFFPRGTVGVYWSAAEAARKTALLNAGNLRRWLRQC